MFSEGIARGTVRLSLSWAWRENEVSWSVADGFEVADEPSKLDDEPDWHFAATLSCAGRCIEVLPWQLGRITPLLALLLQWKRHTSQNVQLLPHYLGRWQQLGGQQSLALRTMAMEQMLATTHGAILSLNLAHSPAVP